MPPIRYKFKSTEILKPVVEKAVKSAEVDLKLKDNEVPDMPFIEPRNGYKRSDPSINSNDNHQISIFRNDLLSVEPGGESDCHVYVSDLKKQPELVYFPNNIFVDNDKKKRQKNMGKLKKDDVSEYEVSERRKKRKEKNGKKMKRIKRLYGWEDRKNLGKEKKLDEYGEDDSKEEDMSGEYKIDSRAVPKEFVKSFYEEKRRIAEEKNEEGVVKNGSGISNGGNGNANKAEVKETQDEVETESKGAAKNKDGKGKSKPESRYQAGKKKHKINTDDREKVLIEVLRDEARRVTFLGEYEEMAVMSLLHKTVFNNERGYLKKPKDIDVKELNRRIEKIASMISYFREEARKRIDSNMESLKDLKLNVRRFKKTEPNNFRLLFDIAREEKKTDCFDAEGRSNDLLGFLDLIELTERLFYQVIMNAPEDFIDMSAAVLMPKVMFGIKVWVSVNVERAAGDVAKKVSGNQKPKGVGKKNKPGAKGGKKNKPRAKGGKKNKPSAKGGKKNKPSAKGGKKNKPSVKEEEKNDRSVGESRGSSGKKSGEVRLQGEPIDAKRKSFFKLRNSQTQRRRRDLENANKLQKLKKYLEALKLLENLESKDELSMEELYKNLDGLLPPKPEKGAGVGWVFSRANTGIKESDGMRKEIKKEASKNPLQAVNKSILIRIRRLLEGREQSLIKKVKKTKKSLKYQQKLLEELREKSKDLQGGNQEQLVHGWLVEKMLSVLLEILPDKSCEIQRLSPKEEKEFKEKLKELQVLDNNQEKELVQVLRDLLLMVVEYFMVSDQKGYKDIEKNRRKYKEFVCMLENLRNLQQLSVLDQKTVLSHILLQQQKPRDEKEDEDEKDKRRIK